MLLIQNSISRLLSATSTSTSQVLGNTINLIQVRTAVRNYLPFPTETRRVRKQGYLKRVKCPYTRKLMMIRILRGDKVIAQ